MPTSHFPCSLYGEDQLNTSEQLRGEWRVQLNKFENVWGTGGPQVNKFSRWSHGIPTVYYPCLGICAIKPWCTIQEDASSNMQLIFCHGIQWKPFREN